MKQNILLVAFGLLLGAIPAAIGWYILSPSAGAHYESTSDLRRALVQRDARDVKTDGSVSLRSIIVPHPSDDIIYELMPGASFRFQGVPVRMNQWGMRGPEMDVVKAPGTLRIALLGDSFAFGWGVEEKDIFSTRLGVFLTRLLGRPVEVLNYGVPGYSSFQQVAQFLEAGLDFNPDLVLVYFVENDFGLPYFLDNGSGGFLNAVDFARKARGQDPEMKKRERELQARLDPNRAFARLDDILRDRGIPLRIAVNPGKSWKSSVDRLSIFRERPSIHFETFRQDMLQTIERRGIDPKTLSLATDPHPSALKHQILAELLASYSYPLL